MNAYRITIFASAFFLPAINAIAWNGADGANGRPISLNADGTDQYYQSNGESGGNGSDGRDGNNGFCQSTGGPGDVSQPPGADGEDAGSGGNGGWGASVTAYFENIANLKKVFIQAVPGRGGYGGRGGRGGRGCHCSQQSWTITGSDGTSKTYTCTSGRDGYAGRNGQNGSNGGYGRVLLMKSAEAIKPDMPSVYIDMSKMETAPVSLSQNIWEKHLSGGRALFKAGSQINDQYHLYTGRREQEYTFQWKASRPSSDFAGWQMLVAMQSDGTVNVTYPKNLYVDSEIIETGEGKFTFIIHSALTTSEIANLTLGSLTGFGASAVVQLRDESKVSDVVDTAIHIKYQTVEDGVYKVRLDADVPASAITMTPGEIFLALGQLGIDEKYLSGNLQVYVGLTVKRSYEGKTWVLSLGDYFKIKEFDVGSIVEAKADADLFSGTTKIGSVKQGEKFKVKAIQNSWVSLERLDGSSVKGWIKIDQLGLSMP